MALGLEQSDTAILDRAIEMDQGNHLPVLYFFISFGGKCRDEVADKAREGTLTSDEAWEFEQYRRAGRILEMMKPKARVSLKK